MHAKSFAVDIYLSVHYLWLVFFFICLPFLCISSKQKFRQPLDVVVGYRNRTYPGYRKLKRDEFCNRAIRERLLDLYAQYEGFPLAESPFHAKGPLCVAEGAVQWEFKWAVVDSKQSFESASTIRDVFLAETGGFRCPWTESSSTLDDRWNVGEWPGLDCPCLFIRQVSPCCDKSTL
jgi:hypothetical protein